MINYRFLMAATHPVFTEQMHLSLHTVPQLRTYIIHTVNSRLLLQRQFHSTKTCTHRSLKRPGRVFWSVQRSKAIADPPLLLTARISNVISIRILGYIYAQRNLIPVTDHVVNQREFRENICSRWY